MSVKRKPAGEVQDTHPFYALKRRSSLGSQRYDFVCRTRSTALCDFAYTVPFTHCGETDI